MEPSHDHIEKTLDKLVASTRSPRGRYSASESWKLLERRLVPPRTKRLRLFRLAGVVAASVLLCFASWFIYDYWKPVAMQTVSAGAAISVITLPDQTKVTLNRYSSLTYPDRFKEDRREVQLQGEAYFEVAKNPEKKFIVSTPHRSQIEVLGTQDRREVQLQGEAYFEVEKDARHPFVVKADPVEVEVLGTHFNVEAYPGDAEVKTTLLEGSVAVNAPAVSSRITLSPGESAIYNRADKTLQEEKTKENNTTTGWRDGHFHFDYLPLREIARELSNAFHVKIKITDEDIKDFRIRAHFTEGESLDQMLDLLQPAGNFSYSKTNDTILIHSKLN